MKSVFLNEKCKASVKRIMQYFEKLWGGLVMFSPVNHNFPLSNNGIFGMQHSVAVTYSPV